MPRPIGVRSTVAVRPRLVGLLPGPTVASNRTVAPVLTMKSGRVDPVTIGAQPALDPVGVLGVARTKSLALLSESEPRRS